MDEKFYEQARAVLVPLSERGDAPDRIWFSMAVLAYEGDSDAGRASVTWSAFPTPTPTTTAPPVPHPPAPGQGETEQALDLIHELADRYPDQSQYPLLEAGYHQRQGDNAQALAVLDKAVSRWPEDTQLLYSRAWCWRSWGAPTKGWR
jgi:tetratricopeptide (TPR) repeat protein